MTAPSGFFGDDSDDGSTSRLSLAGLLRRAGGNSTVQDGLADIDLLLQLAYRVKCNLLIRRPMQLSLEDLTALLGREGVEPADSSAKGIVLAFLGYRLRRMEARDDLESRCAEIARLDRDFTTELVSLTEEEVANVFGQSMAQARSVPPSQQPQMLRQLVACRRDSSRSWSRSRSPRRAEHQPKAGLVTSGIGLCRLLERAGGPRTQVRGAEKIDLLLQLADQVKAHVEQGQPMVLGYKELSRFLRREGTQPDGDSAKGTVQSLLDLRLREMGRMGYGDEAERDKLERLDAGFTKEMLQTMAEETVRGAFDLPATPPSPRSGAAAGSEPEAPVVGFVEGRSRSRSPHRRGSRAGLATRGRELFALLERSGASVGAKRGAEKSDILFQLADQVRRNAEQGTRMLLGRGELCDFLERECVEPEDAGAKNAVAALLRLRLREMERLLYDGREEVRRSDESFLALITEERVGGIFGDMPASDPAGGASPPAAEAAAEDEEAHGPNAAGGHDASPQGSCGRRVGLVTPGRDLLSMLQRSGARVGTLRGAEKNDLLFQLADQVRYNVDEGKRMQLSRGELCRFLNREGMKPADEGAKSAIAGLLQLRLRELERLCYEGRAEALRLDEDFAARLAQIPEEKVRDIFDDMLA